MGRKDASGTSAHLPPVDHYRKQIGKQDVKKGKKDAKTKKRQTDQKRSAMTIQEIVLVTGSGLAMLIGLYMLLFWYLGTAEYENPVKEEPLS
ncbi:triple QxxK/R motif-containing protein-like [Haliotis asinina]|uniref:triple QxxK/R motif-containing protein-like n=1 Tax=Haliotis asinina TaxID=109174 RepID=UPI0035319232